MKLKDLLDKCSDVNVDFDVEVRHYGVFDFDVVDNFSFFKWSSDDFYPLDKSEYLDLEVLSFSVSSNFKIIVYSSLIDEINEDLEVQED